MIPVIIFITFLSLIIKEIILSVDSKKDILDINKNLKIKLPEGEWVVARNITDAWRGISQRVIGIARLENNEIIKGDVIIIRYEGPKGGPGMPEMLTPTSAIIGAGLGNDVAMITDGRFSGGSHGFIIGHVVPEAQEGGPIAIIKNGDIVTINAKTNKIEFKLSDKEFANRQKNWKMPPYKANRGTLYKYIKNVKTASEGCVTDE